TSISTGIKPVCSLRSVSSTQANCPSPEPSKPRHSWKNRGASERERPKPSDLPVALAAQIVQPETIPSVASCVVSQRPGAGNRGRGQGDQRSDREFARSHPADE